MVDIGQQTGIELPSPALALSAHRRWLTWYNVWLAVFLVGPGIVALAVMGCLK